MSRLIDVDAITDSEIIDYLGIDYASCLPDVRDMLNDQPTIEAVPVVHGEWEEITDDWSDETIYRCSVCGEDFVTIDCTPVENLYNFCPNCGAKMEGGAE